MKKLIRLLAVAVAIFVASIHAMAAPPAFAIQKAKAAVEEMRYKLPLEGSPGIIWFQMSYDNQKYTIVYRYQYTIPVAIPKEAEVRERKNNVIQLLKAMPECTDTEIIRAGITYHYNYYDEDGNFLYAFKITPADLK